MQKTAIAFSIAAALAITTQAQAAPRKHTSQPETPVTEFCGTRYCPVYSVPEAGHGRPAAGGHALNASGEPRHTARTRKASQRASKRESTSRRGTGVVRSGKTGASATVAAVHRETFQAYIDAIEATGAVVRFIGGMAHRGACRPPRHKHGCGWAIDVCQIARGVVDARCRLPSPNQLAAIAARYGLFEGGRWCNGDYGHAEVGQGAKGCASRTYAVGRAISPGSSTLAARRKVRKVVATATARE